MQPYFVEKNQKKAPGILRSIYSSLHVPRYVAARDASGQRRSQQPTEGELEVRGTPGWVGDDDNDPRRGSAERWSRR